MSILSSLEEKNYYEILGIKTSASKEEIKQAYKEISLVYHPDSNFFDEIVDQRTSNENEEIFQLITSAYNTLMDEKARKAYDETMIFEFETWNEEDFEEEYYSQEEGYIESDSFSFSDLKYSYEGKDKKQKHSFTFLKRKKDNGGIKPTFEMFSTSKNSFVKFLRIIGL